MKKFSPLLAALIFSVASFLLPSLLANAFADEPPQHVFNNKAWFIWNCDGDLCRYQITGLTSPTINPATDDYTYDTKYIPASEVVDTTDSSKKLKLNTLLDLASSTPADALAPYLFIFDDCIERDGNPDVKTCINGIDGITTWSDFQTWWEANIAGDYDTQKEFAIDPTGASDGKNIISTNGDRNFRATIYDETDYYGISNASSTTDLTYYPSYWNPAFFNPAYDVSETTLTNPKVIQSYLLEPQVYLKSDDISAPISSIEIASSGVPASAVTITAQGDGIYKLVFKSRYYDKVVFQITSETGKTYYVAIARTVVGHDYERNPVLYLPEEDENDYDLIATYYWADGTEKSFTLEPQGLDYGGKGLKAIIYSFSESDAGKIDLRPGPNSPIGVSYTSAMTGSTTQTYKGTLGGSNKGTYFTMSMGKFILDITK